MADAVQANLEGRKVFVAIPTYDGRLNIKTAYNLAQLMPRAFQHGVSFHLSHMSGCSLITMARNSLVNEFLKTDCTELLFIDSDVVADGDDILRLVAQATNKDIAAGLYPRRATDKFFFLDIPRTEEGDMIFDGSMLKVNRVGTGFMLIKRYVFEKLRDEHPEWEYQAKENENIYAFFDLAVMEGRYVGEDYLFCDRAKKAGFECWVDVEISLPHVGQEEFTRNFVDDVIKPMLEDQRKAKLKVANG